jgi:hypothetical protein
MMCFWVMFCPVVGIVQLSGLPVNAELSLAFSIEQPVESHVHGFGLFGLYFAVDDPICHCIISL